MAAVGAAEKSGAVALAAGKFYAAAVATLAVMKGSVALAAFHGMCPSDNL